MVLRHTVSLPSVWTWVLLFWTSSYCFIEGIENPNLSVERLAACSQILSNSPNPYHKRSICNLLFIRTWRTSLELYLSLESLAADHQTLCISPNIFHKRHRRSISLSLKRLHSGPQTLTNPSFCSSMVTSYLEIHLSPGQQAIPNLQSIETWKTALPWRPLAAGHKTLAISPKLYHRRSICVSGTLSY